MKSRILTILLIISIILTCTITANNINAAGSYNITITADEGKDNVGYDEEVTVHFKLKDITIEPGIGAVMGKIEYDKTVFEKITSANFTSGSGWASVTYNDVDGNADQGTFAIERENKDSITIKTDNEMFSVKLKVKEKNSCSAKAGDSVKITLSNITATNGESEQSITDVTGTLKIKDEQTTNTPPVITGVTDGGKYTKPVTPVITDDDLDTVELYKDGNPVSGFTSGTRISEIGTYKLIATDKGNNRVEVNFTIEKEQHEDSHAYKVIIDASSSKVEVGSTVTLKVIVDDITVAEGIGTFAGKIEYDQNVFQRLEADDLQGGKGWEGITFNPKNGKLLTNIQSGHNINSKSTVFTATFKVLDTAPTGETVITLTDINASNGKTDLYVSDVPGKITIVEKGSLPTPTPSQGGATPTPSQGGATPTPSQGGTTPTPSQGGTTPTPSQGGTTPTPSQGGATPTPSQGGATPTPSQGGATPTPSHGDAGNNPPVITGVKDGETYYSPVTPKATDGDGDLDTVELYKDGTRVVYYYNGDTIKETGNYRIVAKDKAGNQTVVNFKLDISGGTPSQGADTTPPAISGVSNGATYSEEVTVVVTDDNLNRVIIYKNGNVVEDRVVSGNTFTVKFSTNATYKIVATDTSGNRSEVTFTINTGSGGSTPTQGGNTTPAPTQIVVTPTPTKEVVISDTRTQIPYAGIDDLILPAIYVIAAMGAIAYIQYRRIKGVRY